MLVVYSLGYILTTLITFIYVFENARPKEEFNIKKSYVECFNKNQYRVTLEDVDYDGEFRNDFIVKRFMRLCGYQDTDDPLDIRKPGEYFTYKKEVEKIGSKRGALYLGGLSALFIIIGFEILGGISMYIILRKFLAPTRGLITWVIDAIRRFP